MNPEHMQLCCRHCQSPLHQVFVDLQTCPPSNAMVKAENLNEPEVYYPLKVFVCDHCFLVQTEELERAEAIFNEEYTYFSSFSSSYLEHARQYVETLIDRFTFNADSLVIEIASNDGYMLQYFKQKNIPVLGIDPTANTAAVAKQKGIDTIIDFFSSKLAHVLTERKIFADLLIGNNVLAHVPDINDFVSGIKKVLKPGGILAMEFPHLVVLVEQNQFDTVYHEHFSYLSFTVVSRIFAHYGITIFDVEEVEANGGSLRIFAKHSANNEINILPSVQQMLAREEALGISTVEYYRTFQGKADKIKYDFLDFLMRAREEGKKVIGYGAAAKGNTLLNYCGIKGNDLIRFVVDASPYKQGKYLPGSRIPVVSREEIYSFKPDYIIILPWNLTSEIMELLKDTRSWGAKFVTAIPELRII